MTSFLHSANMAFDDHVGVAQALRAKLPAELAPILDIAVHAALRGSKIFWCGNGGSAADSQHLAAELIGRFKRERRAIASVALTTDTSVLTALANDYSYDDVFARQVEGLIGAGDLLFALSTSGNSKNVINAVRLASDKGAVTIGLLGRDGGQLKAVCKHSIIVPSVDTARIQEMHILIGHIVCDAIESAVGAVNDPR